MNILPSSDLNRSSIAKLIGQIAQKNELFLSHYEYRYQFETPEIWKNPTRQDLEFHMQWVNGALSEYKYQSFRNDIRIGSFHPGHQSKWTTHELCHGIVGFAWNPEWNLFQHAISARLSELLPVVVFYFLDEMDTLRCSKHQFPNIFYGYCQACEEIAGSGFSNDGNQMQYWADKADQFFKREIESIQQSLKLKQPNYHIAGGLNLMSDGLAYVSQQELRIQSQEYHDFIRMFYTEFDMFNHIDDLMNHVQTVYEDMKVGRVKDYGFGPSERHKLKDMVWRLFELSVDSEIELKEDIFSIIDETSTKIKNDDISSILKKYIDLSTEWEIPDIEKIFGLGYEITNTVGYASNYVLDGIKQFYTEIENSISDNMLIKFIDQDQLDRQLLPHRFELFLNAQSYEYIELIQFLNDLNFPQPIDEVQFSFRQSVAQTFVKTNKRIYKFEKNDLILLNIDYDIDGVAYFLPYRDSADTMTIFELAPELYDYYQSLPKEIDTLLYSSDEDTFLLFQEIGLLKGIKW